MFSFKRAISGVPLDAVLFDLDGTLYPEEQYVRGAYDDVASFVATHSSVAPESLANEMYERWLEKGSRYPYIFREALDRHGLGRGLIDEMVSIFNDHVPCISPYPGADLLLETLAEDYKLAIVTDGHADRQRRKIAALGIAERFRAIVFTANGMPKPDPWGYVEALMQLNVGPEAALFVGDSPDFDLCGARDAGLSTVYMRPSALRAERDAVRGEVWDYVIDSLTDLLPIVTNRA